LKIHPTLLVQSWLSKSNNKLRLAFALEKTYKMLHRMFWTNHNIHQLSWF